MHLTSLLCFKREENSVAICNVSVYMWLDWRNNITLHVWLVQDRDTWHVTRAMVRDSPSPGPRAAASPGTRRRTPRAKSIKRLLASNLSPFQVTNDQWEQAIWSRDHMLTCDWLPGAAEGDRVLHEADHREVRPDQVSQGGDRDMVLLIININFAKIVISGLCKTRYIN